VALTFTIGGVDLSSDVQVKSFRIEQSTGRRGDTAKVRLIDYGNALAIGRFAPITITDGNPTPTFTLFSGWIVKTRQATPAPSFRTWDLTCSDATIFVKARTANKVYLNAYVTDIVRDLVLNASPPIGLTCTNVTAGQGPLLASYTVNRGFLFDQLTKLAKQASGSGQIWDWNIDYALDLHFFYASQAPASGYALTDQAPPLPAPQIWYNPDSFYYEIDDSQLGTQVLVRGGTYLSAGHTQTWTGNAVTTGFQFDYAPDIPNGGLPTVTVGGVGQTVAMDTGAAVTTQWLISQDVASNTWTLKVGTASAPGSGVAVVAVYFYDLPVLVRATDFVAIQGLATLPNGGIFERYVADSSLSSLQAARTRATAELGAYSASYLNAHAEPGDVASGANPLASLGAGQTIILTSSQLGVAVTLLIVKLIISGTQGQFYHYALDLQG
jgi:hypothetical protein